MFTEFDMNIIALELQPLFFIFNTFSNRESETVRLLMAAALIISCLASSVLPLLNNHLADSGINLKETRKVPAQIVYGIQVKQ